MEQRKSHF